MAVPLSQNQKQAIIDGKIKPGSGASEYLKFIFNLVITLPFLIVIGIPLIIIFQIVKLIQGKKRPRKPEYLDISEPAQDAKQQKDRQFDIVLFGATGFTGRLCAEYLAKNHENIKWAIAGRSQERLEQIRSKLAKSNPQLEQLPILIADSSNKEQLVNVIKNSRVVLSTVGPFSKYGNFTVALCAQYGTHYIDSTGEVAWVREMIHKYDDLATKSGARLISCCGLDCIPWDLITYAVNKEMVEKHTQKLLKIECFDEMYQAMSGGTFSTLQTSFLNPAARSKVEFDPLQKILGKQEKSAFVQKSVTQKFLGYHSKIKSFVGMWALADGNAAIVKRSNALLGYNEFFKYFEAYKYYNFFHGFNDQVRLIFIQTNLMVPPMLAFFKKFYFPKVGEGHSAQDMDQGYLKLVAFGAGADGAKVKATFTLPDDPGYRDTARMLSEAALTLCFDGKDIKQGGGFLTPAMIGDPLIKRLVDTGSILKIE